MIPRAAALGILLAVVGFLLSEMGFKGKRAFALFSLVVLCFSVVGELGEIFSAVSSVSEEVGISGVLRGALKVVGLGYVFGISSDVSEELGEKGIAKGLTLVGRVEIFGISLPYIKDIIELGIGLIK